MIQRHFTVGDESEGSECVPFLSEYTDCSEANICTGCSRCSCTAEGRWSCRTVHECPKDDDEDLFDEQTISNAYEVLFNELADKESKKVVLSTTPKRNHLLDGEKDLDLEEELKHLMSRAKRSANDNPHNKDNRNNNTIKFYHTLDDLNEDTLKDTNASGTIEAKKVVGVKIPKISRRASMIDNKNISGLNDLHIEFNQLKEYDHHIVGNKIDSAQRGERGERGEHELDEFNQEQTRKVIGNYSQIAKDKDLSKLVVNELKKGSEIIGDKFVAPVSNITFTPDNDTLTAMAFIAGNLLNKLWKMEKESSVESIETEVLKHEKIADLLEVFKEPLTMRQEVFIKNALERLSEALYKDSKIKNISLCETLGPTEINLSNDSNSRNEESKTVNKKCKVTKELEKLKNLDKTQNNSTAEAVSKINNVLNLISKFEQIQKQLHILRAGPQESTEHEEENKENVEFTLSKDEITTVNIFGNLLEKITKLLLPRKKSKKLLTNMKRMNLFGDSQEIKKELERMFDIDTNNMSLTTKDKLVIDYLNIFKMNSDCVLKGMLQKEATKLLPKVRGDTVNSISKLLKIKSLNDYVDLMLSKKETSEEFNSYSTTEKIEKFTMKPNNYLRNNMDNEATALNTAKDKIKNHLNAIMKDLIELQNQNGFLSTANRSIVDVLPCISKILNWDKDKLYETVETSKEPHLNKITTMFEAIKNNLKRSSLTRRSDSYLTDLPQSSKIWQRVIKNLNRKRNDSKRRTFKENLPKSFEKIKEMINRIDLPASSYKQYITLGNVSPASHLILFKVLHGSVKQIKNILDNIKTSMDNIMKLPIEERFEIQTFVDNAARVINLNDKILDKLKMSKNAIDTKKGNVLTVNRIPIYKQPYKTSDSDVAVLYGKSNLFKLTRDQVLIQLMKNRVQLYLRIKEAKGFDANHDVNYDIARRIMAQLMSGNYSIAKELFKVFVANTEKITKSKDLANFEEQEDDFMPRGILYQSTIITVTAFPGTNSNTDVSNLAFNDAPDYSHDTRTDVKLQTPENLMQQFLKLKAMNL